MDRKNHEELQDDLVEYVEVTDEEILEKDEGLEEANGHNPETAPSDAVKSVDAAGDKTKKQPLRKGDKQNSEPMKPSGLKAKEAVMAKEGFDFEEDLDALVESEATLSESFREKAELIFEAALSSKLTEHVERLEEQYQTQLDEEVQRVQENLVEKIDGYLNYVVESWTEENKLAIGNGLRTEIAESFMSALHGVFTEHYIQVPDEKADLVDGLAEKIEDLEEQLNKTVQDNIELSEAVKDFAREAVIRESAKDLSEAQAEKLKSLVEDITFDSEDSFTQKVETIKESYFRKVSVQTQPEDEQLDEGTAKQVEVSPLMETYLKALKK
jgi:mRNA-degrading endonuclease RelE of RelBE toxin-antitoxin system